jgi:TRAP-type C4-dicarboxylate transport system permease small subunit
MEFLTLISSLINTASIKIWVFVVLLFVFFIAMVIIILALITRNYNKRKEKKELKKRREVLKARLNELTGKSNDEEIKIGKLQ